MKRFAMKYLFEWKEEKDRKPLIIRGARQVGKSYIARQLGMTFNNLAEANFEFMPGLKSLFEESLDPENLIKKLSIALDCKIIPGETLLFFDEIQACPEALTSLRYFYEKMPELHLIAAGSLIDFILEKIGIPVGRVRSLYLYPLSFYEFLVAGGNEKLLALINDHDNQRELEKIFHKQLLSILGEYMAVGGMPEAVNKWITSGKLVDVRLIHNDLIDTFRQDFAKFSKKNQIHYMEKVFSAVPGLMGKKFIFSTVDRELRSRELKPALELLIKAGIVNPVTHTSANGVPLGAEAKSNIFKLIFLDIALAQSLLGIDTGEWILNPEHSIINRGEIAEAFTGQEILCNGNPFSKNELFYWVREKRGAGAEVDYVTAIGNKVIPIEIKSGKGGTLKSMRLFLEKKKSSPFGVYFSQRNFSVSENIFGYPLYGVGKMLKDF